MSPTDCYVAALEIDPTLAQAWNNLGTLGGGTVSGQSRTASECYEAALEINPRDAHAAHAWYYLGLGWNFRLDCNGGGTVSGQFRTAKECYEAALEINPAFADAWFMLGNWGGG